MIATDRGRILQGIWYRVSYYITDRNDTNNMLYTLTVDGSSVSFNDKWILF